MPPCVRRERPRIFDKKCGSFSYIFTHPPEDYKEKHRKRKKAEICPRGCDMCDLATKWGRERHTAKTRKDFTPPRTNFEAGSLDNLESAKAERCVRENISTRCFPTHRFGPCAPFGLEKTGSSQAMCYLATKSRHERHTVKHARYHTSSDKVPVWFSRRWGRNVQTIKTNARQCVCVWKDADEIVPKPSFSSRVPPLLGVEEMGWEKLSHGV